MIVDMTGNEEAWLTSAIRSLQRKDVLMSNHQGGSPVAARDADGLVHVIVDTPQGSGKLFAMAARSHRTLARFDVSVD
jgi:hypothetical protein